MGCSCATERTKDLSYPKVSKTSGSQSRSEPPSRKCSEAEETTILNTSVSELPSQPPTRVRLRAQSCIQHLSEPLELRYNFLSTLESSRNRTVTLAEFISTKKRCVIEKVCKKGKLARASGREQAFQILRRLDHPHIRKLYEVVQDNEFVYMISETCDGGTLTDILGEQQKLPVNQAALLMNQLFSVVNYCHSLGVVHGKLDLTCIALKSKPTHTGLNIKVAGFSKAVDSEVCLPAPEVLGSEATAQADMWSCGIILYRILIGKFPCKSSSDAQRVCFPAGSLENISADAVTLIRRLLSVDPRERPTAAECLSNPWVQRFSSPVSLKSKESRKHLANLRSGINTASLREAVLRFILDRVVAQEQIDKVTKTFEALDVNGDGILSREELRAGLRLVMTEEKACQEVEKIMQRVAVSGSDQIDYSAFLLVSLGDERLLSTDHLLTAFRSFDLDGSEKISVDELKKVFNVCRQKGEGAAWNALIKEVDTSGDGEIDFDEFCALMRKASN